MQNIYLFISLLILLLRYLFGQDFSRISKCDIQRQVFPECVTVLTTTMRMLYVLTTTKRLWFHDALYNYTSQDAAL